MEPLTLPIAECTESSAELSDNQACTGQETDDLSLTLTGFSDESEKNIFIMISNSPHPVSFISYGGFVRTRKTTL